MVWQLYILRHRTEMVDILAQWLYLLLRGCIFISLFILLGQGGVAGWPPSADEGVVTFGEDAFFLGLNAQDVFVGDFSRGVQVNPCLGERKGMGE
jgi:hypothetical protein